MAAVMQLLTKVQVCKLLKISPRCLALWVAQGKFPAAQRIGRKNFWTRAAVERWKTLLFSAQENWTPGSATRPAG
jgi:predicted DNA-binding transcriptional regulator AlpA